MQQAAPREDETELGSWTVLTYRTARISAETRIDCVLNGFIGDSSASTVIEFGEIVARAQEVLV